MGKYYFSAKAQQEFADVICQKALDLGVPPKNIILNREGCRILYVGIYIKFENSETYKEFCESKIQGIVEAW